MEREYFVQLKLARIKQKFWVKKDLGGNLWPCGLLNLV
jgi:hypothetical protein